MSTKYSRSNRDTLDAGRASLCMWQGQAIQSSITQVVSLHAHLSLRTPSKLPAVTPSRPK